MQSLIPGQQISASPGRWSLAAAVALAAVLLGAAPARAFCGFYVAKADTTLFNRASQVVLVRDGDRTVVTMSNDYRGDLAEFAMVIPVPAVLERDQIEIGDRKAIEHLDAYTAPRLVEYYDPDPCRPVVANEWVLNARPRALPSAEPEGARASGVTIEASYTVGEYDILILSARQSDGLLRWLTDNGYHLPDGAAGILGSYIKQGLRFFVAKVNLEAQSDTGFSYLRPLRIAYESPRFVLPIRLGTLNAEGAQELFVYTLTRTGRVETTNYRTTRLPSGMDLPPYIKGEFGEFYTAMFAEQVRRENMRTVFLEYAWDMGWCDPCAADPLSPAELRSLGVFWLSPSSPPGASPLRPVPGPTPVPGGVFVTRLHVRYDGEHFPADLRFQETGDRQNFQGRYVLRHPYRGEAQCDAATAYRRELQARQEREVETLASLTGWKPETIRKDADLDDAGAPAPATRWWEWLR